MEFANHDVSFVTPLATAEAEREAQHANLNDPSVRENELLFPKAPQPEIVRAAQKDAWYESLLASQFSDVASRCFGM